jgi:hypothetical protein
MIPMSALLATNTAPAHPTADRGERAARAGLWALPAYGLLLGLSTWTHQPSIDDFDAYARYITTDVFWPATSAPASSARSPSPR